MSSRAGARAAASAKARPSPPRRAATVSGRAPALNAPLSWLGETLGNRVFRQVVQAAAGGAPVVPPSMSERLTSASGGEALPAALGSSMGVELGRDLGSVRVHHDAEAAEMSRSVDALAFTHGTHIYFGGGQYAPDTDAGKHLLVHELVHTVQQNPNLARIAAPGLHAQAQRAVPTTPFVSRRIQRQEGGEASSESEADDWTSHLPGFTTPPAFGNTPAEAGCPRVPTRLGDVPPEPICPTRDDEEIEGTAFHFCLDSDVFSPASDLTNLVSLARTSMADTIFTVHGFSSDEGTPAYNRNLSCHRAKRVARELINAGVRSERIRIAAKGATTRFSDRAREERVAAGRRRGTRDRSLDRVALVQALASGSVIPTAAADNPQRRIVNQARAMFANNMYLLGADAYMSHWSCGLAPSLARAVSLMTIRIEGEDARLAPADGATRLGVAEVTNSATHGVVPNEIVISQEAFSTTNPMACIAARIADMTFHHMVRHVIGTERERHEAALFFIELAGLPPCETPAETLLGNVVTPAQLWWNRPAADPRQASPDPPCAPARLPGAIAPQPVTAAMRATRPSFSVGSFSVDGGSGPTQTIVLPDDNLVSSDSPRGAFRASAQVTATGTPTELANYQVGFLQTIVADEELVDYADGHRVRVTLPVPIRDGPPGGIGSPWFDARFLNAIDPTTRTVAATLSDSPAQRAHYQFVRPEMINRARRAGEALVSEGNVLNRAVKRVTFKTWLAARRNDASADPFSTVFLEGRTVTWEQNIDVIGTDGAGNFSAVVGASDRTDTAQMQLRGSTPADFPPLGPRVYRRLQTEVLPPTPRAQAGGLGSTPYRDEVRRVADTLEPYRRALGLTDTLSIRLRFELSTGRLVTDPAAQPVRVCFDADCRDTRFAEERRLYADQLLIRLRRDLVHAPQSGRYATHPYQFVTLTPITPIARYSDPFSPAHGLGVVASIDETLRLRDSEERQARNPNAFDTAFMPRVNVRFRSEEYRFDFSVSDLDIEQVCESEALVAGCCVPEGLSARMSVDARPHPPVTQTLNGVEYTAPLGVDVVYSPVRFTIFVPSNRLNDGVTLNHELHHLVENHNLLDAWKTRLARTIRARAMEVRRDAASHTAIRGPLLEPATLRSIALQEVPAFTRAFGPEYTRRHDIVDTTSLPRVRLPAGWSMPPLIAGSRGTL